MALNLITDATAEPVTKAELKLHLRITGTAEDNALDIFIASARRAVERHTGRALITQTWELVLSAMPMEIELPRPPLQSITHIKYLDWDNDATTVDSDTYVHVAHDYKGKIRLKDGSAWPTTDRAWENWQIRFVAGYGDTSASIPADIRNAVLLQAAFLFENRGDQDPLTFAQNVELDYSLHKLMYPYVVIRG